jgi:Domain of unknown function (DUF1707)
VAEPDDLRVSDQERDRAAADIREHFAAGRLTEDELSDRVQAAYTARTRQELSRLLADLPKLPASPAQQKAEIAQRRSMLQRRLLQEAGGGSGAFLICTVIWAASGASGFFWPIFVALGVLVPLIKNGWRLYGPAPEFEEIERELESRRQKNEVRGRIRSEARSRAGRSGRHDGGQS